MARFRCRIEECLYIGDSEVDVATGKNAGVKTIAVPWGFRTKEELKIAGAQIYDRQDREIAGICNIEKEVKR